MPVVRRRSVASSDFRVGVELVGTIDGANLDFDAPELFVELGTGLAIAVFWNGVRQKKADDYTVSTTGPAGTGETVSMLEAPRAGDKVTADYVVAT